MAGKNNINLILFLINNAVRNFDELALMKF